MALQTPHVSLSRLGLVAASSLLLCAAGSFAQRPVTVPDPANLTGEAVSPQSLADTLPVNHGAPALAQLLKKLRTRASLMMIVAHPDDEDGGMLTYESRGQGARVAMLTLTRGEGGQNLMTADFNDALGLIRTQELLAADRYMGVDQFFGSVVDFGFSKTPEETLAQWTHERVLYDTVRAVRLYRPLVLTSTWIGGVTDGHGHHQVSGQMNQEVFNAAADPKVFPEMGLPAWAPLKVYARMPFARVSKDGMFDYATGKSSPPRFFNYVTKQWTTTLPVANVMIPEGTVSNDPGMEGDTYLQFARKGLALQKTQIGGNVRPARAGNYDAPYTRYGSRVPVKDTEQSFFDGIDVSLPGIADLAPAALASLRAALTAIDGKIAEAQRLFAPEHPERTVQPIHDALATLDRLIATVGSASLPADQAFNVLHELRTKRVQMNRALVLALGLEVQATLVSRADGSAPLTPGASFVVQADLANGPETIDGQSAVLRLHAGKASASLMPLKENEASALAPHSLLTRTWKSAVPPTATPTQPYFRRSSAEQPVYEIEDSILRDAPQSPDPLVVEFTVKYRDVTLSIARAVQTARPGSSDVQTAVILPPLSLNVTPHVGIVSTRAGNQVPLPFLVRVRTNLVNLSQPRIEMEAPPSFHISVPKNDDFTLKSIDQVHTVTGSLTAPGLRPGDGLSGPPAVRFFATSPGAGGKQAEIADGYQTVGYKGLTPTNFYRTANLRVVAVDVATAPNLKIAYLPGTGDEVAMYLPNLGIAPTQIGLSDLTPASLAKFDAVLLGVRAYAAYPELGNSAALLDYAKSGGVVIVQYNTARYGDEQSPYPIAVPGDSAHNVVEEAQPVTIVNANSPVLHWPNQITADDFKGWTEELGHGFAASWDSKFEAPTETHDPGQDPQRGGLLYARTGRGAYVYVAYALYRQLPEGVPGAYRLFANLLSLPKNAAAGIQPIGK